MTRNTIPLFAAVAFGVACSASAATIINEVFETGYDRTTQNIASGNLAVYKGRSGTVATSSVGALAFDTTGKAGADMFWGYFTDPGATVGPSVQNGHVIVGVGETLTVNLKFSLSTMPTDSTYGLRFGLFDDTGSRQAADLASGGSSAAFNPNPGFALFVPISGSTTLSNQLSLREHTAFNNNIFNTSADFTQIGSAVGGTYNPLSAGVDYRLTFNVSRQDASTTELSASIINAADSTVMTSGSVLFTGAQQSSFSWFGWRIPNPDGGGTTTFKDINVTVTPIPEPSTLALTGLAVVGLVCCRITRRY